MPEVSYMQPQMQVLPPVPSVVPTTVYPRIYYHFSTTNKSFLEMHYFLKDRGINNHSFHLMLLDPDLARINPYDPNLTMVQKTKIQIECQRNYWYFIREIVRVPSSGITTGVPYQLNRGNLALSYCATRNLNIFMEQPRQTGKTIGVLTFYLWLLNFGTTNSRMSFLNKKLDDSKYNLSLIRELRELLPSYLQMDSSFDSDGNKLRARNNVETLTHPTNNNSINTIASARNVSTAASLMRGRTVPLIYADEWAFIPFNKIVYENMMPAFMTASSNAAMNGKPFGIIMTTTPGLMTTDEGQYAFMLKENATRFDENFYDIDSQQLNDIISANGNSNFIYIKFTYQQLGKSEEWFRSICINMNNEWPAIRREILLEWSQSTNNSPFNEDDLNIIKSLVKVPIKTQLIFNKYIFNIYEMGNFKYPPLIGVDVSGGYKRDSSAIVVVDSYTTNVIAEMNNNAINTLDLAAVIIELVTRWMPNAIVNVERNGGFGGSVLAKLVRSPIKGNLFYTIKDKVIEERVMGMQVHRKTQKVKVYGSDSTKNERDALMEILRDRVDYHKDKIISPIIYNELCGLEVKKSGKIEHSNNTHDDSTFAWLWALYMYYNGNDLMNTWGVVKRVLKTDQDLEEAVNFVEPTTDSNIIEEIENVYDEEITDQLASLAEAPGKKMYAEWLAEERAKDEMALQAILMSKAGRKAYEEKYHTILDEEEAKMTTLPESIFINTPDIIEEDNSNLSLGERFMKFMRKR